MLSTFVVWSFLLLCVPPCAGRNCVSPSPKPSPSRDPNAGPSPPPQPWYYNRYFYFSNRAPVTETLKNVDGFVETVDETVSILEGIEQRIVREQQLRITDSRQLSGRQARSNRRANRFRSPSVPFCNLEDLEWAHAAQSMFVATFNLSTSIKCVTDFTPRGESEERLHDLVTRFRHQIDEHALSINRAANSRFPRPDTVFNYPHSTQTEDCMFNAIAANRHQRTWYLNAAITNVERGRHVGDFERKFLVEYVGRGGRHANMTLRERRADGTDLYRRDASTLLVLHHGSAKADFFKNTFLEDNVAVIRAVGKARHYSEQVYDALSASSISILVFPLLLNTLPIALFADVSTRTMLLYAIVSDVLTTIPLLVKGIELISIGSRTNVAAITRISSWFNGTLADVAAAEVFVASCKSKQNVLPMGVLFVGISLAFLIAGLAGEVLAREYVAYRRRKVA